MQTSARVSDNKVKEHTRITVANTARALPSDRHDLSLGGLTHLSNTFLSFLVQTLITSVSPS